VPAPYELTPEARFSCQQCAGCCHHWFIYLTPEEYDRLHVHDWALESPRLAGQPLFVEQALPARGGPPAVRLAKIDGACAFLESDGLCLIHKVQGMAAKPSPCQQYPFHFARTPDGAAATLDFACTSVLADKGALLAEHPEDVDAAYDVMQHRAQLPSHGLPASGALGEHLTLQPEQPLHWQNYRTLEGALLGALMQAERPLETRLLGLDRLLRLTAERFGDALGAPSEEFAAWAGALGESGYAALWDVTPPAKLSAPRQRAVLAPFIGGLEQQWQAMDASDTSGRGIGTRLTLAIIVANGVGPLQLAGYGATLDQSAMRRVRFPQDDPALAHLYTRYLKSLIGRKTLVDDSDVFQGFRYFLLSFAAARWYTVARAALAGRAVATEDDLRQGIRLIEKGLGHAEGLRTGPTQWVVRFLFQRLASAGTMIHSFYTGE
jgi:Fe-S-cluster containining protein